MHAGAIACGLSDGFGDGEGVAPGRDRIKAMPDLRGVDRDMDV
jgi:hypothetical protein